MRFIANLLDQSQSRRVGFQANRRFTIECVQALHTRSTCPPLGYCNQRHSFELKLRKRSSGGGQLPTSAIDEHEVRHRRFALAQTRIPALQGLPHSPVVIARG